MASILEKLEAITAVGADADRELYFQQQAPSETYAVARVFSYCMQRAGLERQDADHFANRLAALATVEVQLTKTGMHYSEFTEAVEALIAVPELHAMFNRVEVAALGGRDGSSAFRACHAVLNELFDRLEVFHETRPLTLDYVAQYPQDKFDMVITSNVMNAPDLVSSQPQHAWLQYANATEVAMTHFFVACAALVKQGGYVEHILEALGARSAAVTNNGHLHADTGQAPMGIQSITRYGFALVAETTVTYSNAHGMEVNGKPLAEVEQQLDKFHSEERKKGK